MFEKGRNFRMNDLEDQRCREWLEVHKDHCGNTVDEKTGLTYEGSMGPKYPNIRYCFVPTGIGNAIVIECSCGRSVDITDLANY